MFQHFPYIRPVAALLLFFLIMQSAASAGSGAAGPGKPASVRNALLKQQPGGNQELTGILQLDKQLLSKGLQPGYDFDTADDIGRGYLGIMAGTIGIILFIIGWSMEGTLGNTITSFLGITGLIGMALGGAACCWFTSE